MNRSGVPQCSNPRCAQAKFELDDCIGARTILSVRLPPFATVVEQTWRRSFVCACIALLIVLALAGHLFAVGDRGVAATIHPLATDAAIRAMKDGGNAIDGAVAAALTLGVVDGHNSGIGGGCFVLIRTAKGAFIAIDGRETAPAAVGRETYLRGGKADTELSQTGALAAGVPGSLAAYDYAMRQHGKLTL